MFDAEVAIEEWRRRMRIAGIKAAAVLDELESHLREEIERQTKSGASPQQAVEVAIHQIGSPEVLNAEFAKARVPDGAVIQKWVAVAYGAELNVYTALQVRILLKSGPSHAELWLGIAGLAVTLAVAYAGWHLAPRWLGVILNRTLRRVVVVVGGLSSLGWMAIFAWMILPQFDFTPGQFAAALIWAFLPMLAAPTLFAGIDLPESTPVR